MEKDKKKSVLFMLLFSGAILLIFLIMQPLEIYYGIKRLGEIAMLFPKGIIALKEINLLYFIQVIMLLVIIPVYFLTFAFCWYYDANHPKGKYAPTWGDNFLAEALWWGIPLFFTIIISIVTIYRTYELDPFKKLEGANKPMRIQVVALQWKWLFIYPEEKIATVNFFQFPKNTPLNFEITADAPMNSFWIPQLGGQIYAMPKMRTELHLIADKEGSFRGSSANLSGIGFAGMHFIAKSSSQEEYDTWLKDAKKSQEGLDWSLYTELAKPSENNPVVLYQLKEEDLFNRIIMKYMHPAPEHD